MAGLRTELQRALDSWRAEAAARLAAEASEERALRAAASQTKLAGSLAGARAAAAAATSAAELSVARTHALRVAGACGGDPSTVVVAAAAAVPAAQSVHSAGRFVVLCYVSHD
jgi:hypothetical protein